MKENNSRDSVSVKEIEEFAKRHRFEVFFSVLLLLATVFGILGYFKPGWSLFFSAVGSVLGLVFPYRMDGIVKNGLQFILKQEKTTLFVLGILALIVAVFLPLFIFAFIGIFGGRAIHQMVSTLTQNR